jgi:hypothetical protein
MDTNVFVKILTKQNLTRVKFCLVNIFVLLVASETHAQKNIFLKPTGGIQSIFSDFSYGNNNPHLYQGFDASNDYWGVMVQYNLNSKIRIAVGISESDIGWGYKIKTPRVMEGHTRGAPLLQFPLKLETLIKEDVRIGRLDKVDYRYAMIFDLYLIGGVSYDWFRFNNFNGVLSGGINTPNPVNDVITVDEKLPNVLHRHGASIQAGIGFQFKSHDKDRLDIQLVYSQGLRKLVTADVDYTINQTAYFLQMAARGSAFRITASYPIRLSKRKKAEE